ncbi:DUF229 and/or Phosphodiest domain containing protein [Asbolus verrucosus]|uniref:DUF229 and/or Phosphodiest domain containing protein n=1 Tax=Asbolus verrucosus TaxID=1661398 RepID=A0A482W460_ASBVE|nr:DUF229 and/or Phosphodiest domain containing protein [Asbolus verrucosus]
MSFDIHQPDTSKRRLKAPSVFWLLLIICGILLFMTNVFQSQHLMIPIKIRTQDKTVAPKSLDGFVIKTPGCRIPYMDPFDRSVEKFIFKQKRPVCNNGIPALVDSNMTSIFLVESSLAEYTHRDISEVKCCYVPFYRREPRGDETDDKVKFGKNCFAFNGSAKISFEFIKVKCDVGGKKIYTDMFSFVPNKIKERKLFKRKPLNILIVGLDGVSRLNFHRQMPKTVQYLKSITQVEFLGYNKIAYNTFPNLVTLLTGMSEWEFRRLCWKNEDARFDKCPFIWKDYKAEGFVTSFGEDASWMGAFNYIKKGFKKQPTDYMWGVFDRAAEYHIGNSYNLNLMECMGAREVYKIFLNHIENFVIKMDMERLPYFAFYWGVSLSHDYLNKPNQGDEDYHNFFKNIKENGHLDNTAMIVMSDHGIRWGDIRKTYQGRMEERLPFNFVVLPDWYKEQYQDAYNNLLKNTRRLTTPYDMHETLKDLLNPFHLTRKFLQSRYQTQSRGYSLFNEIPPKRTCEDAGIDIQWCTCQQSIQIDKNDSVVIDGANFAVKYINQQLKGYAQCSNLTLYNIPEARIMTYGEHILNGSSVKDYTITFQTLPGKGTFEVTLRSVSENNSAHRYEVMGPISRLNLYGQQSNCITDFHLKLYCYCKSSIW